MKKKTWKEKFFPQDNKEYLVTDQCFYEANPGLEYNTHDPSRKPHTVQLVDKDTGTIVNLPSGSIIKIIKLAK